MLVSDFDYHLPEELIAQEPPPERSGARMMTLNRMSGAYRDRAFRDFPSLLRRGDVLVINTSRVIPARLFARRRHSAMQSPADERIEILLVEEYAPQEWKVLARPARKLRPGEHLEFLDHDGSPSSGLTAEVLAVEQDGERLLRFASRVDFYEQLELLGHMPLPPYIHRQDRQEDRERYQTVYAEERGSVAAPTAGLHLDRAMLDELTERGVHVCSVALHVGLGTFQPVRVETVEEIRLHNERYTLPEVTAKAINAAKLEKRRVVAVGTTTVRTLESCYASSPDGALHAHSGATSIFIAPGFCFRVVDALLTNFHLPKSTLLMLVCAFGGSDAVMAAYRHAVEARYRFFSYGDCMFIS